MGGRVADGAKVEMLLKKFVELAKDEPGFAGVKLDADEHEGVRFHTLSVDLPAGDDAEKVFGDRLDVVVGIGTTSAYLAVGKDGLAQLKTAIDQSAASGGTLVSPFEMKVSIGQILRFASSVQDDPALAAMAQALAASKGNDHLLIGVKGSDLGVVYRFELQEGVLRAIGQAASQRAQNAP
jgi:hypothetical protein